MPVYDTQPTYLNCLQCKAPIFSHTKRLCTKCQGDSAIRLRENQKRADQKYKESHPEKHAEAMAKHRAQNLEKCRQRDLGYYYARRARDPEAVRATANKAHNKWKALHPEQHRAVMAAARNNRRNASGFFTADEIAQLDFQQMGYCALCGEPYGDNYSIDHIIPITKGGVHWIYNIQLTHLDCNRRKNNKIEGTISYGLAADLSALSIPLSPSELVETGLGGCT